MQCSVSPEGMLLEVRHTRRHEIDDLNALKIWRRVGGCRGFFGDDGRRIGKRAGNRCAVPGHWEENSPRRGGSV
jgi:hypothetical protein